MLPWFCTRPVIPDRVRTGDRFIRQKKRDAEASRSSQDIPIWTGLFPQPLEKPDEGIPRIVEDIGQGVPRAEQAVGEIEVMDPAADLADVAAGACIREGGAAAVAFRVLVGVRVPERLDLVALEAHIADGADGFIVPGLGAGGGDSGVGDGRMLHA